MQSLPGKRMVVGSSPSRLTAKVLQQGQLVMLVTSRLRWLVITSAHLHDTKGNTLPGMGIVLQAMAARLTYRLGSDA